MLVRFVFTITILMGLYHCSPCHGQSIESRLDSVMNAAYEKGIFNGNVLVAQNGKTIFKRSFGYADGSKSKRLTTDMLFDIGSISKEFNGAGILLLQEKGKLNLDDALRKYLKHLPAWADSIPLRTLINYTSGLPITAARSDQELNDELMLLSALPNSPGKAFAYSYSNVYLQRQVIEKISGVSYKEFIEKNFLKPLGMKHTAVDIPVTDEQVAHAFDSDFKESIYEQKMKGWVRLSIDDLYSWLTAIDGYKVVSKISVAQLDKGFGDNETSLGNTKIVNGELIWHQHHGSNYNYEALITHDLKEKVVVILMTNSQQFKVRPLTDMIFAVIKNEPYTVPKKSLYLAIREKVLADIDKGIAFYRDIKANQQHNYDLSFEIGDLTTTGRYIMRRQQWEKAIAIFSIARLLDAGNADMSFVLQLIAECYEKMNFKQLAIIYYEAAVQKDARNLNAAAGLARLQKN